MTMASSSSSSLSSLFKKPSSSEAKRLTKRQENVFKKANELSILCGVEVCVIYYGSYGELKTWPEDREKVKDMARSIKKDNDSKNKKKKKKRAKLGSSYKYPDWHPRFDKYSVEQLEVLIQSLERSQTMMQHRLRAVVESQRQRNMHYTNMAGQEQIMVQERSNQASMNLFNHGNSTLPQSQASISASNEAYSLAPLPNSLTIHQDPNMEMYSRLLASQGAGMNEVFNTSMLPYNGFNTNCLNGFSNQFYQNCFEVEDPYGVQGAGINNNMKVEDYSGLLWTQGTGMNGLQNGYNSNNNNTNGYPHQLVQTPPVYQYMDRSTQSVRPLYEI
ncbi:hypothetical protein F2Q69_00003749 [Brassica cretica]|uniref:MADS-box domain-containing protein n=1 Tax=Brassica cretica TaxID=69181 RepID=A0A8S9NY65_BRACR|nr:hypothetical protein F2Q69_00003749 [Brassica cretica]